jgi:lysophospholipase L1-like esterase
MMRLRDTSRRSMLAVVLILIGGCGSAVPAAPSTAVAPPSSARPGIATASTGAPTAPSVASSPASADSSSAAVSSPRLRLVAIGDSLARASSCSGCTDFVDLYGTSISAATGMPVDVDNEASIQLSALPPVQAAQLLNDILVDPQLRDAIRSADIVVVNVGFNDTPWNRFDNPCGASNLEATEVDWAKITGPCIERVSNEYGQTLDQILSQVDELRGCFTPPGEPADFCASVGKPTTLVRVVTVYDDWIGESGTGGGGVAATEAADRAFARMQCWIAAEHGGQCADVYYVLDGPNGTADAKAFLGDDHTHLNQQGHQRVADVLAGLGFAPLK